MIDFTGQVVIVTGAGRGIGRLFALDFARRGASVVVNDLGGAAGGGGSDSAVADAVVDEIRAAGGKAAASGHSVATPEGGEGIVRTALDAFGRVDAVVNNAGIVGYKPFEELSVDEWNAMLAVHSSGSFHVSQPAYKVMKSQGYGRFVFMSSSSGMLGNQGQVHYGAAKTALLGLKNVLALEGQPHGILANLVMPWGITRMITEELADHPEVLDLPMMKIMRPELVAPMVVYLASRDCTVTRQDFSAGAGRFARLFTGTGPGWFAGSDVDPTADDVAANFAEIDRTDPYYIPFSVIDESSELCRRHGIEFGAPA